MTQRDTPSENRAGGDRAGTTGADRMPALYDELRAIGRALMQREAPGHTLQPTVLVHEAFLRLSRETRSSWNDDTHLKAVAATAMRRVLIDHARRRAADKRGGPQRARSDILDIADRSGPTPSELVAIDDALLRLASVSQRQAQVVEMRYFGGMTFEQVADLLSVSINTAKNDWRFARAWLQRALDDEPETDAT